MSDFLQSIPRELLQTIIEYTSTHDILRLKLVSNRIYSLITSEQLFKKQKYRGYPRQTGQCAIHDMTCYAKKFVDDISNFEFDTSPELQRVMFDDALEHLVQSKIYLVRGDLILFVICTYGDVGKYIFDGHRIIDLSLEIDEISVKVLPQEFTFNEVLIKNYWDDPLLHINKYQWLDIMKLRPQLLLNITNFKDGNNKYYTTFKIGNKTFTLVYETEDYDSCRRMDYGDKLINITNFREIIMTYDTLLILAFEYPRVYDKYTFGIMVYMRYYDAIRPKI